MLSRIACAAVIIFALVGSRASALTRFDFEDGTLQGWKIVSGEAGKLPTGPETARPDQSFGQHGRYFIGLYENPAGDAAQIVLRSPVFTVSSDTIGLLVGGGNRPEACYVALYKATDDSELFRETGANTEMMTPRYWDVSALKGQLVYAKIVDAHTGGWGHINVDDIHEMSPADEQARVKEAAEKAKSYERWLATIDAPAKRIVYSGKALGDIAMPLGGVGAGPISICGDGTIRQWQVFGRVNDGCVVPDSFFAVWARSKNGKPVARLLQEQPIGGLTEVTSVEFVGEYPIAEITYHDPALPVAVSLKAFSPHIPTNAKDSAIPTAIFEFTIRNKSAEPVDVSLLATLQNAAGYDGVSKINGVWNPCYGGNLNSATSAGRLRGVLMANPSLAADARQYGTMALAALDRSAQVTPQWNYLPGLWSDFSDDGALAGDYPTGPSGRGQTWNAALTVPATLAPGSSVTIPILWTWHFPNLCNWWDGREGHPKLGRMYANWFADAASVGQYVAANYERLAGDTERFRRTFHKATLPYWMLDRISA